MNTKRKFIVSGIVLVFLGLGAYFIYKSMTYVTTDDAQVQAHVTMLSSKVNGTIQKVMVEENQHVKAGDVLAQIDTQDYSTVSLAAQANVAALQARAHEAEVDLQRASNLFKSQAISRERYDNAQANSKDLEAKLKAAQAQFEQANLNVSYTKILAPSEGVIARKSVEVGQFVPTGQPLFGFVASNERWVIANLKETDLEHIKKGLATKIDIDAVSNKTYDGEVESIGPSTGAVFSLLPPDNATGNFTKVVQRVPVRIKFAKLTDEDVERLQAGLSAYISIRIR